MKKVLSLLATSLLIGTMLVGCNGKKVEPIDEEELINKLAANAISDLGVTYSSFASDGVFFGETNLTTTVKQFVNEGDEKGLNFSVSYSIVSQYEYTKEFLKLNEDKLVVDEIVLAEDLDTESKALGGAAYTLKASLKFAGYDEGLNVPGLKQTDSFVNQKLLDKNWNAIVKVTTTGTLHEIKSVNANDYVLFYGRFGGWYENSKAQLYTGAFIYDGDDAVMIYAGSITSDFFNDDGTAKIVPGDAVQVFGYASPYNGLMEIKPKSVVKLEASDPHATAIQPLQYTSMTVAQMNAADITDTGRFVQSEALKLDGALPTMNTGKHWTIKVCAVSDPAQKINIYINYHVGADAQNAIKSFLEGLGSDSFVFKGVLSSYNAYQLTPVNTESGTAAACFLAA